MYQNGHTAKPGPSSPPMPPSPPVMHSSPHIMAQSPYTQGMGTNRSPYYQPMSPAAMPPIGGLQATPGSTPLQECQQDPHHTPPFPSFDAGAGALSHWSGGGGLYSSQSPPNENIYSSTQGRLNGYNDWGAGVGSLSPSLSPEPRFGILGGPAKSPTIPGGVESLESLLSKSRCEGCEGCERVRVSACGWGGLGSKELSSAL